MSTSSDRPKSFWERHLGAILSGIWGIVAAVLFFSGAFVSFDDYLNALIFQLGYKPDEMREAFWKGEFGTLATESDTPEERARLEKLKALSNPLYLVKKDEVTSSLIQANPGRSEYASIIRFLGSGRQQKIPGVGPRSCDVLDLRLALFDEETKPLITTSLGVSVAPWVGGRGLFKLTEQFYRLPDLFDL
ncbi:MAG TPA: hypothetical protein PKO06_07905, partial [Candidatus Ozemobacteraceae bacterium]|nr:hypothetical protein [Candidatus Ozemobacteraceae bacterium]